MKVEELMSRNVKWCRPDESTSEAARIMWEHDLGSVVVVDPEGRVAGMITDRDICMGAYSKGKTLKEIGVWETMSHEIVSCQPTDSIETAEDLMRDAQVRRLAVIDSEGRLHGLLSLNDIALEAERSRATGQLPLADVALTLSAVCKPHPNLM